MKTGSLTEDRVQKPGFDIQFLGFSIASTGRTNRETRQSLIPTTCPLSAELC